MAYSIRDRLTRDFYVPLFAGLNAALRSLPFNVYAPYTNVGGTAQGPGGIGEGEGGFDTPVDATINTPSIVDPTCGTSGVREEDTVVGSNFGSSNGQTHVASRWFIELLSPEGDFLAEGTGIIVYDSGIDTSIPKELDLLGLGLKEGYSYRIRVRYKGSNGGWSAFSDSCSFRMGTCLPDPLLWLDGMDGIVLDTPSNPTRVIGWTNKGTGPQVVGTNDGRYPFVDPTVDVHNPWPLESISMNEDLMDIAPAITGNEFTVFLVMHDDTAATAYRFAGLAGGDLNAGADHIGMLSSGGGSPTRAASAQWETGGSPGYFWKTGVPVGQVSRLLTVRADTTDATSGKFWMNNVYMGANTDQVAGAGSFNLDRIGQGNLTYGGGLMIYAEIRVYEGLLSDAQVESVNIELMNKWGI